MTLTVTLTVMGGTLSLDLNLALIYTLAGPRPPSPLLLLVRAVVSDICDWHCDIVLTPFLRR